MDFDGFRLAPHVRACADADCAIFLDLRRNRYWAAPLARLSLAQAPERRAAVLGRLHMHGLLVRVGDGDRAAPAPAVVSLARPVRDVDGMDIPPPRGVIGLDGWRVAAACGRAALEVGIGRLDLAFARRARRRARVEAPRASLAAAAARFLQARPWFPRRRVCLFDALALSDYLLGCGHRPYLVIGVRARPFAAHCWVQHDDAVLNDASDRCRTFVPIACV
jgi:hypothetical protein